MSYEKRPDKNDPNLPEISKHQKRAAKHKRYGIEEFSSWSGKWHCWHWYATEKARDQAFINMNTKSSIFRGTNFDSPVRKVDR